LLLERETRPVFRLLLEPEQVEAEIARLRRAVETSRKQIQAIRERLSREVGVPHAYIFDAHLLMLEDPLLLGRTLSVLREQHVNAEWALRSVSEQLHQLFDELADDYLRERSHDLDDVLGRIQLNLSGAEDAPSLKRLPGACILVAEDLGASETASLDWERVLGVALGAGSQTDHVAIVARSRGIPTVAGLKQSWRSIPPGALLVLDGGQGRIVVEPSGPVLEAYRGARERVREEDQRLQELRELPATSRDGVRVHLRANVEFVEDAGLAQTQGAEGIGLFRSEYLLSAGRPWPDEREQVALYRGLLERVAPHPVTVRLWDVGSEDLDPLGRGSSNPALGERALRLARRDRQPFKTQVRALLRAAAHGPLRLLLPFVAGVSDLEEALELIEESRAELGREGREPLAALPVGVNVEVPAAALQAAELARRVSFLALGTNDLIQYLLAVDRGDPKVACFYQPLHPAVLRLLHGVFQAGREAGVPVSVCGEMAAEALHALVLVGLGARELSMTPAAVPRVKSVVRGADVGELRALVEECLALPTATAIERTLRGALTARLAGAPLP
jgi:phosphotransferase system enzyme I (PtsI)